MDAVQIMLPSPENFASIREWSEACGQAMVAGGFVTRHAIQDGLVNKLMLLADPLWEQDFITNNWIKRTPEFMAARVEAEERLPAQCEAAVIALGVAMLALEAILPHQEDGPPHAAICGIGGYDEVVSWDYDASLRDYSFAGAHKSSGDAIKEWRDRMLAYRASHDGDTLWWRWRPEIEGQIPFGESEARWRVYSRFVIGNVADTLIERLKRGEFRPNRNMIADNLITATQLEAIGWVRDELDFWTHPDFPNAEFW